MGQVETIKTVCGGCHNMCPMYVDVQNNQVVQAYGVEGHHRTNGTICSKGLASGQIAHDPRRVIYPMRRNGPKGSNSFERISWDDALKELAEQVHKARDEYGNWSINIIRGQACGWGFPYDMAQRLAHCLGIEVGFGASECFVPRAVSEAVTYGSPALHYDYDNSDLLIFWGRQPAFSSAPSLKRIYDARDRGAKMIVIDPLHFHVAANADQYIQVEPGTDLAVMLGMIHEIIKKGLWDTDFVNTYTNDPGLKRLTAHINGDNKQDIEYTPEWAERISGVPADVIKTLAYEYATTKRAALLPGHGLEGRVNVAQTTRALAILRLITGHIDGEGCEVFTLPSPPRNPNFTLINKVVKDYDPKEPVALFAVPPYTPEECNFPLLFMGQGLMPTPDIIRMMREGKTKVAIAMGANPMNTQPQPDITRDALEKLDYLCCVEQQFNETTEYADLILPAGTYLERTEPEWFKWDYWTSDVTLRQKCIQVGEALGDAEIIIRIGRALGFTEEFPTEDITWYIDEDLKPSGFTYEKLKENPFGIEYAPVVYNKYEESGFQTPDGKGQIYSDILEKAGFSPLPIWIDSSESHRNHPELKEDYPFVLFTGRSGPMYVHGHRRTVPWLRELEPIPQVFVNPKTAEKLGIEENDWTKVSSPRGEIKIRAKITGVINEKCLYVPGCWTEANYNHLGIEEDLDPITSQANYMTCLGNIEKIKEA